MRTRCYRELRRIDSYEERFKYLQLRSSVGAATFGFERYVNQQFYTSSAWRSTRNLVIARDLGRDLGIDGYEIHDKVFIHHMNPMSVRQIEERDERILDPEYLICVSFKTHNAVHYGDESLLVRGPVERRPGDTKLW